MTLQKPRPISIAVAALGGQGGGVLAQWIVDMAEANGYIAQSTSVPGVAQRTGATIYFLELFPEAEAKKAGKPPILALMPVPGDVDICIASELVEAGRSITRGFVSPGLTSLIASSHRIYAIAEKERPGDGRIDEAEIRDAARKAAKKLVMFDMDRAAEDTGSVISSVLFGALAGSGALPFSHAAFEETIKQTGKAVNANLAGFERGFDEAQGRGQPVAAAASLLPAAPANLSLNNRIKAFPEAARAMITEGVRHLVDYQDRAYAGLYLDRIEKFVKEAPVRDIDHKLLTEVARYLALWMGFEDVIRVADLKTRTGRFEKIRDEVRASPDQYFNVVEYFHPRFDELCDCMPAWLGGPMVRSAIVRKLLGPFFEKGRNLSTAKLSGFLPLYFIGGMRRWRRSTLRYKRENAQIQEWLDVVKLLSVADYDLAVEAAQTPRLIKGYGDTRERGFARFRRIMDAMPALRASGDAALKVRALREAALAAEDAEPFDQAFARAV